MADLQLIIYLADIKLYAALYAECVFLNMASHSKAPLRAVGINSFKGDTKLVQVGRKDSHVLSHLHRQKTTAQSTAKHQHNR